MTLDVFLLLTLSSVIQASWNFVAKRSASNRTVLILLGWFMWGIVFLPISCLFVDLSGFSESWVGFVLLSGLIHVVYISLLGWGYAKGDISVVYPVSRGLGIAGTTAVTSLMGGALAAPGLLGIASIAGGTSLIGFRESFRSESRQAFFIAVAIGCTVILYSVVDSIAVKTVPPLFYIAAINLVPALIAAPILLTKYRADVQRIWRFHLRESILVAVGGSAAYVLVLMAFQRSEAAYVVALREFSVVIAAALGVLFLNETLYRRKVIAIALIVLGMISIKMVS